MAFPIVSTYIFIKYFIQLFANRLYRREDKIYSNSAPRCKLRGIQSNCARPPYSKGMGYASGLAPGSPEVRNHYVFVSRLNFWIIVILFSVPRASILIKSEKIWKPGEGSLHPQPKGWGISDPLQLKINAILEVAGDSKAFRRVASVNGEESHRESQTR